MKKLTNIGLGWGTRKFAALLVMTAVSMAVPHAAIASSITINNVTQRWPWNNKVDITYTVDGGQTRSAGVYCGLRFVLSAGGRTCSFEGYTIGASAENGRHVVTWTAPEGIFSDSCTMTATLFSTNVPSGDDYMIVDLTSGDVVYEGLFATQDESNARYNVAANKTDKMVLRKIPRTTDSAELPNGPFASGYPTGDNVNYSTGGHPDTERRWITDRAYYMGVFPVTQYQYQKIYGSNPSNKKTIIDGNTVEHRPVENVSWDDLRLSTTASTSSIPVVASKQGTFFQRLNYLTGNRFGFDLPTEVMAEIAERAGATTVYYWGNEMVTNYVVCSDNSGESTVAVGSRLPNNWGLYDTAGNVWEWCLDVRGSQNEDMAAHVDVFTPLWEEGRTDRRYRGGGNWYTASSGAAFRASYRTNNSESMRSQGHGFRVAMIAK